MKQTVEEAARDYLQGILETTRFEVNFYEDNYDAGARDAVFDVTERSFKAGAEWQAKQSPWISVEEQLPDDIPGAPLIVIQDGGETGYYTARYTDNGEFVTMGGELIRNVKYWMPIPTFDQILEANKDVFQRLKDK